jgi:predicted RNA-binding Zn-ribbon protein involved in translation (DUF1610 family)
MNEVMKMNTVSCHCSNCHKSFRVLEDEQFDHDCPNCGPANLAKQPEHWGDDMLGDEILMGDSYIELPNGEVLLESNLEDYLIENLGWVFKTAE